MGRPSNWYNMSDDERRAWSRQDREREDAEYERQQAQDRAEQAARDARRSQEAARAARSEYESNAESYREEIDNLQESLCETRLDRDALAEACRYVADMLAQTIPTASGGTETVAQRLAGIGGARAERLILDALKRLDR